MKSCTSFNSSAIRQDRRTHRVFVLPPFTARISKMPPLKYQFLCEWLSQILAQFLLHIRHNDGLNIGFRESGSFSASLMGSGTAKGSFTMIRKTPISPESLSFQQEACPSSTPFSIMLKSAGFLLGCLHTSTMKWQAIS